MLGGVNSRSKIELGLGVVGKISSTATTDYYDNDEKEPEIFKDLAMLTSLTAILGYRYQPPVDGVSFRVVYTPLYHTPHDLLRFGLVWFGLVWFGLVWFEFRLHILKWK